MMCAPAAMRLEREVLAILNTPARIEPGAVALTLAYAAGSIELARR